MLLQCASQTMLSVCRTERSSMFQCEELIPEVCPRISGTLCIHYKILHSLGSQKCHLRFLRVWPTNQPTKKVCGPLPRIGRTRLLYIVITVTVHF